MTYFVSRRSFRDAALALMLGLGAGSLMPQEAKAQQVIGFDPQVGQICSGPLGPGPCAAVFDWMRRNSFGAPMGQSPSLGMGIIPNDGVMAAQIAQQCGANPVCIAGRWAAIEASRCTNGIGVAGGCFGPNGEIDRRLPHNFRPSTIIQNGRSDLEQGPGPGNELRRAGEWLGDRTGIRLF